MKIDKRLLWIILPLFLLPLLFYFDHFQWKLTQLSFSDDPGDWLTFGSIYSGTLVGISFGINIYITLQNDAKQERRNSIPYRLKLVKDIKAVKKEVHNLKINDTKDIKQLIDELLETLTIADKFDFYPSQNLQKYYNLSAEYIAAIKRNDNEKIRSNLHRIAFKNQLKDYIEQDIDIILKS